MSDITTTTAPETAAPAARRFAEAGQWTLIFRRFRRHRLAYASLFVMLGIYLVALLAEFVAPFSPDSYNARFTYGPPILRQSSFCLDEGAYAHGDGVLVVSRGLGVSGLPWRFGARPEAMLLTIL